MSIQKTGNIEEEEEENPKNGDPRHGAAAETPPVPLGHGASVGPPSERKTEKRKRKAVGAPVFLKRPKIERGSVRVAKYRPGSKQPTTPGFRNVLIHTNGKTLGGDLSPYVLRDECGCLLENVWQFSKVYASVSAQRIKLSRFHPDCIIWEHPAEEHCDADGRLLDAYWKWRHKGMYKPRAVRYPNGFHGRHRCLFSVWPRCGDVDGKCDRLGYIEARKKIYCGEYARLAPHTPHFKKLKAMLDSGVDLQIVEVDGPDPNLDFPPYDQISPTNPGLPITEAVIRTLINDSRKPFGHGYVIAALLLGGAEWLK